MMYGKLFESMYDGTLVQSWEALVTFQQMIVLADDVGVIDITPQALSARTGIPIEILHKGIHILESDDINSRSPNQNGRRLERLDSHREWGWKIVNYLKYRQLANHQEKKQADRIRIAKKRAEENANKINSVPKCRNVSQGVASVAFVAHTDTDTDTLKDMPKSEDLSFDEFWTKYPRKVSKKKTRIAWNRITKSDQQKILIDITSRFIDTKMQFVPYPTSYLHNESWNDELETKPNELDNAI